MKEEINQQYSFDFFPAIKINKQLYKGNLYARNVFEAVCSGFKVVPQKCYDENMLSKPDQEGGSNAVWIILLIIGVIGINVIFCLICKKYAKKNTEEKLISDKEFNSKVDQVVANYMQLKESQ